MMFVLPSLFGQTGGEGVYDFLRLSNSARSVALGGIQVALPDADPGLVLQNPALLSREMSNSMSVGYANYLAGIGFGYGAYARDLEKAGMVAIGIQFVNYGEFVAANETGVVTGNFSASDYAVNLSYAKSFGSLFTAGVSLKPIYSHLEQYSSFGIAADFGIVRCSMDHLSNIALCVSNIGTQLKSYYDGGIHEKMAWSIQLGYSRRLEHAPLRMSVTAYDLNRWGGQVTNTDPNGVNSNYSAPTPWSSVMRHLCFGAEIFPENRLTFRIGYNYRRHSDLTLTDQTGLAGFSAGLGVNLTAFHINYALSSYFQSGLVHQFSLSADLARFLK